MKTLRGAPLREVLGFALSMGSPDLSHKGLQVDGFWGLGTTEWRVYRF